MKADPLAAREHLKRCFQAGKIGLHETPEGVFLARTELLGEIFLVETRTPAGGSNLGRASTSVVAGAGFEPRPSGYEPDELPGCSTPQQVDGNLASSDGESRKIAVG